MFPHRWIPPTPLSCLPLLSDLLPVFPSPSRPQSTSLTVHCLVYNTRGTQMKNRVWGCRGELTIFKQLQNWNRGQRNLIIKHLICIKCPNCFEDLEREHPLNLVPWCLTSFVLALALCGWLHSHGWLAQASSWFGPWRNYAGESQYLYCDLSTPTLYLPAVSDHRCPGRCVLYMTYWPLLLCHLWAPGSVTCPKLYSKLRSVLLQKILLREGKWC